MGNWTGSARFQGKNATATIRDYEDGLEIPVPTADLGVPIGPAESVSADSRQIGRVLGSGLIEFHSQ